MRLYSIGILLLGLIAAASAQGFFESLRQVFRPRRQNQFQPQQNRFRPPSPQNNNFRPVQQSQNNNQGFLGDVGLRENTNSGFNSNNGFSNNGFRPNNNNGFRPNNNNGFRFNSNSNNNGFPKGNRVAPSSNNNGFRFNSVQSNRPQGNGVGRPVVGPPQSQAPSAADKFINRPRNTNYNRCAKHETPKYCPPSEPNHYDNATGKWYLLTWNIQCSPGTPNCECTKFTGDEAMDYCNGLPRARPISLDTPQKKKFGRDISAQYAQRYYWTGARIQYPEEVIIWPNGVREGWRQRGEGEWSHTGGSRDKGPQPDNRNESQDHCEPEFCIGVLNNFYADGIKWHDVACHHKKPTICEFD